MRYGSLTRTEDDRLVQILGGEAAVRALIASYCGLPSNEPPKYGDLTRGQIEGGVTKLSPDIFLRIASGEPTI